MGKQDETMDLPAEFGGFSKNEAARIAVRIPKANLTPAQADKLLSGTCVDVVLIEDPNAGKDKPGQQVIDGVQGLRLEVTADILRYTGNPKCWGFSLNMNSTSIDVGCFAEIAGKSGRVEMTLNGPAVNIGKNKKDADDDGEDDE